MRLPSRVALGSTIHPPAIMDARGKLGCIAFGEACVYPLRGRVCMGPITGPAQPMERRAGARDRPRFAEWYACSALSATNKAIHASVESVARTAPPTECCLDLRVTPVHAGPRPLPGHLPSRGYAGFGDLVKSIPQRLEDPPMSLDLQAGGRPPPPIEVLVGRASRAWQRAKEQRWDAVV